MKEREYSKVVINGKEGRVPNGWDDVDLEMFLKIKGTKELTDTKLMSVLSGVSEEDILDDPESDLKMFELITWIENRVNFENLKVPEKIRISGKLIKIPEDIGYESYRQKIAMQNVIKDSEDIIDSFPMIAAIYLYPLYSGSKYKESEAKKFAETKIKNLPVMEIYPICSFFFGKTIDSMSYVIKTFTKSTTRKKLMQE